MPILLCSLGTSWAVVPEAFHLLPPGADGFSAVHVITSDTDITRQSTAKVRAYFAARHVGVDLTIAHVDRFTDLRSDGDHFRFEEALFRWILARASDPAGRHICLAGGFKTMSAAMQRAAGFFGAAEVFHVLADPKINTPELVDTAIATGDIAYVRLGTEPGWPALRELQTRDFPLIDEPGDRIRAEGSDLGNRVLNLLDEQRHLAANFTGISALPFPVLTLRSPARLDWLRRRLQPDAADHRAWLARLPKIELHCHLGGFATHGTELAAVRAAATNPESLPSLRDCTPPSGWPLPPRPYELLDYMRLGDNNGRRLLRDPGCLRKQCELLYEHLLGQNVIYAEIRCSPNNYVDEEYGRSPLVVLRDIRDAFQDCMNQHRANDGFPSCHVNLLIIATRKDGGDRSDIARHLALAITAADEWRDPTTCRVVGVDLAGFEHRDTRAALFAIDFEPVHRVGLAVTVHAGENDDVEGIWQAVFKLNARRLGHALHLGQSPDLLRAVADRRIAVEMCPHANLQIKGFPLSPSPDSPQTYPLLRYLRSGIPVTVNTDNIGISAASLTDNLILAARLCPEITPLDMLQLQRNGLDTAFAPPDLRFALSKQLAARLA